MKLISNAFTLFIIIALVIICMQDKREKRKVVEINERELVCLAHNIVMESANQPNIGQAAVAWVTLNRVRASGYPDSICGVVWQDRQFSWTHDGKPVTVTDMKAVSKAVDIALAVVRGKIPDPSGGALHFYNPAIAKPAWKKDVTWRIRIQDHDFVRLANR
jgi:spore germination cell wall hydrolase CwlJ-like protein